MRNSALEIAAHYVDQILYGEILPPTMLEYMIEIEDGHSSPKSLFEQAGLSEDQGYQALGVDRTDLYKHIINQSLETFDGDKVHLQTAESAYARAKNQPHKSLEYTEMQDMISITQSKGTGTPIERVKHKKIELETARLALSRAAEDASDDKCWELAEEACSDALNRETNLTIANIDYYMSEINARLNISSQTWETAPNTTDQDIPTADL